MKTKTISPFLIFILPGLVLITACQDKTLSGSVGGVVSVYDPLTPLVKTPLDGIRVFVVNKDYELDSSDYANNAAAVVGSDVTGADGQYLITAIPEGNYAVIPVPDSIMYRFQPVSDSDTMKFRIIEASVNHSVDFTAAIPGPVEDGFHIRLTIINRPAGGLVTLYRPVFLYNIVPTFNPVEIDNSVRFSKNEITMDLHSGIIGPLYVVSNNFKINAMDPSGKYIFACWIEFDYFNTPAHSQWQIDWPDQTITRVQ